ncbi:MAG: hypothetical protein JO020_22210 [Chloroflexi bacterium]|nr:hypothetical protein [Chloroflexota bacterium]MBV9896886.1 hypothetical protein [Chloroflexota bacterium]
MVAPASIRSRSPAPITSIGSNSGRRSKGTYFLIAIPVLLALTFVWQLASSTFHTEAVVRAAVAVGKVSLEPDPSGTRIDMVLVDRFGQETTFNGTLDVSLREPDGALWKTTRNVSAGDFQPLPEDSLMAGRVGYTITINAGDWARPPRRGGLATVSISATPSGDTPSFSTQSQQQFP